MSTAEEKRAIHNVIYGTKNGKNAKHFLVPASEM